MNTSFFRRESIFPKVQIMHETAGKISARTGLGGATARLCGQENAKLRKSQSFSV